MTKHDQYFMRMAITEAADSEWGGEDDPKVGAVVARNGELVGAAHRGQKAKGDHAEFTLLHKTVRSKDLLSGATLYTTLEPCTTRSHNKRPCAAWIVEKGIRRVVIGILDPNPTICGRGYWHLVDAGIEVEFFPPKLARRVIDLNAAFIQSHRGGSGVTAAFASAIARMKSPIVTPYIGMGWGDDISLQNSPSPREGWPLSQIRIKLNKERPFPIPTRYRTSYKKYFREFYDRKRFMDDGEKFMLEQNPIAFSDTPSLYLLVRPTLYSHVQFYRDNVATIPAERNALIDNLIRGSLMAEFPHSLCMHMVVVTSDNKLLLTKRSPKVAYYPGTWSASAEEQLSREDLKNGEQTTALNWGKRLLKEELGLEPDAYHTDNLRILSVFLESDILNTSVCGYAELRLDSGTLNTIIKGHPRTDYEFTEWTFMDLDEDELLSELFRPKRSYHPTSGYRLLQTLFKNFGSPKDSDVF